MKTILVRIVMLAAMALNWVVMPSAGAANTFAGASPIGNARNQHTATRGLFEILPDPGDHLGL